MTTEVTRRDYGSEVRVSSSPLGGVRDGGAREGDDGGPEETLWWRNTFSFSMHYRFRVAEG